MSKKTLHVAVDPGAKGAIIAGTSLENFSIYSIPETLADLVSLVSGINNAHHGPVHIWMERNTGYMAGITRRNSEGIEEAGGVSPKAMYVFGLNTGRVEGVLQAVLGSSLRYASPIKWMNAAGIVTGRKKFLSTSHWKNILKQECITRFDGILLPKQITLVNCDALLIYHTVVTGRLR